MYNPYTAGSHCVLRCSNSQQHYLGSQVRSHVENSWSSTLVTTLAVLGHTVWRLMVTSSWPGSPAGSRLQQVPITTQQRPFLDYQTLWSLKSKMTCCPPDSVLLFPSCHNHPHPCPLDNLVVSYFPLNIVVAAVFFYLEVPLCSLLFHLPPTSPVLLKRFLHFQTTLLMFWWPGSLSLLPTLTEELLSPTSSQTLMTTTLHQPSCCFSHSLFVFVYFNPSFVPVLLCSVCHTDGTPPTLSQLERCLWSAD